MAKRIANKDISNWMVVVMLVAVILVSTFSIILFLDAAEDASVGYTLSDTAVAELTIVDTSEGVPSETVAASSEASISITEPEEEMSE